MMLLVGLKTARPGRVHSAEDPPVGLSPVAGFGGKRPTGLFGDDLPKSVRRSKTSPFGFSDGAGRRAGLCLADGRIGGGNK